MLDLAILRSLASTKMDAFKFLDRLRKRKQKIILVLLILLGLPPSIVSGVIALEQAVVSPSGVEINRAGL